MQSACWYAWTKMWGLKQLLHCCQNCWALAIFICYICLYYWIHGVSTGTSTFMGTPMFRRDVTIMGSVKTMRRNYKIFRKWLLYEKKKRISKRICCHHTQIMTWAVHVVYITNCLSSHAEFLHLWLAIDIMPMNVQIQQNCRLKSRSLSKWQNGSSTY